MTKPQLIETDISININNEIKDQSHIAVDTEFMRERTFFAKLCLVQVATPKSIYCIDVLSSKLLKDFWHTLSNASCVIHSARQDLEIIYQTGKILPAQIFDTQIASGLVGFSPQISYASLVEKLCGKILKKNQTRANWSKRPFSKEMIEYAGEDVEFLLDLHESLSKMLEKSGRLIWAQEDSDNLLNKDLYNNEPKDAINRIKGAQYLSGKTKKAVHLLAEWREKEAIKKDLPRKWILKDKTLFNLASSNIKSSSDLDGISNLPNAIIKYSGEEIIKILRDAQLSNKNYVAQSKMNEKQKKALNEMQKLVLNKSEELEISPEIIASKKEMKSLLSGNINSKFTQGWRKEVIGNQLLELLS